MRAIWRAKLTVKVQAAQRAYGHHAVARSREVRWLSATAAGGLLGAAGLLTANGPVLAKEVEVRQEVWAWGRREGIPGGADKDVLRPARIKWFEGHKPGWKKLAFGPSFGAALDRSGQLFIWGVSEIDTEDGPEDLFIGPTVLEVQGKAAGQKFVDVQCSSTHIFALSARGGAYVFEGVADVIRRTPSASDAPLKLEGQQMPGIPHPAWWNRLVGGGGVTQMSIGLEHAAFLTHRGEVLCTGGNQWGQCGEEPPKPKEKKMGALEEHIRVETLRPVRVTFPENARRMTSVVVGGHHTIATDELGQAFAFGDDRRIQLGIGDTRSSGGDERNAVGVITRDYLGGKESKKDIQRRVTYSYYAPHCQAAPVELIPPPAQNRPPYPPASHLACGQDFNIAVHRDSPDWYEKDQETNVLFCCGENGEGQCGRNRQQQQQSWQLVRLPKRSKAIAVACGQGHSIALMSTGELWGWGLNQQGEVGCGTRASTCPPAKVQVASADDEMTRRVVAISCGFRNSGCICEIPPV